MRCDRIEGYQTARVPAARFTAHATLRSDVDRKWGMLAEESDDARLSRLDLSVGSKSALCPDSGDAKSIICTIAVSDLDAGVTMGVLASIWMVDKTVVMREGIAKRLRQWYSVGN